MIHVYDMIYLLNYIMKTSQINIIKISTRTYKKKI